MFREDGFTLPWSEDWIWQMPVLSQQIMTLSLDAFRSGVSWKDPPANTVPPQTAAEAANTYERSTEDSAATYQRKHRHGQHVDMLMYLLRPILV